ncbi:MAG: hypothetical protein CL769_05920 [Chloroflexi bacterium]|nr:hypothetical protein [Chloroflexota bacterium]|tara:strand:+ start:88 stop:402 length:315 start_codon:yes stop_codon:yes gene_type:complete
MDIEKIILFQIYLNSQYGNNEFSLSEFSEKFLSEEIKNSLNLTVPKLKFANAVKNLEENNLIKRSSKHHLTTLSSWRLTTNSEKKFEKISIKKINNYEDFKSNF